MGLFHHRLLAAPVTIMLLSVGLYALYPPLANLLLDGMGPLQLALMLHFFAAFTVGLLAVFWKAPRAILRNLPGLIRSARGRELLLAASGAGILNGLTHLLFYYALSMTERFDVTALLIYETWPMLFFLIDTFFRQRQSVSVSPRDFMLVFVTFFGFATLMFQEIDVVDWILFDSQVLQVAAIAALGGIIMAVSTYGRRRSLLALNALIVESGRPPPGDMAAAMVSELMIRSINAVLILGLLVFSPVEIVAPTASQWAITFLVGGVTIGIASVLYDLSIFRAANSALTALWYLMPVASLAVLAILQGRLLSSFEAVSSIMIVSANILIGTRQPLGSSFALLYLATFAIGLWCVFVPARQVDVYLELVSVSAIFYILIGTHALDQVSRSIQQSEELYLKLRRMVVELTASRLPVALKRQLIGYVDKLLVHVRHHGQSEVNSRPELIDASDRISTSLAKFTEFDRAEELVDVGARVMAMNDSRLSGGEYVVMILLAALNVTVIVVFRNTGLLFDLFAFTVSAAAAYLLFLVFERDQQIHGGLGQVTAFSELSDTLAMAWRKVSGRGKQAVLPSPPAETLPRLGFLPSMAIFTFVLAGFAYALSYKNIARVDPPSQSPMTSLAASGPARQSIGIAVPDWASARVKAHVIKEIAEQHLAMSVNLVPAGHTTAFESMASAQGNIDIIPEVWMANVTDLTRRYVSALKTVRLGAKGNPGQQGLCINEAARQQGVPIDIAGLTSPEVIALFDYNGDGRGDLWAGAPDWSSTGIELVRADAYGLTEGYETTVFDEPLLVATLQHFNNRDVPLLFFCYMPSYFGEDLKVHMLDEGQFEPEAWAEILLAAELGQSAPQSGSPWPVSDIHIGYSARLDKASQPLLNLLHSFRVPLSTVSDWSYRNAMMGESAEDIAREWVAANPDTVLNWLLGRDGFASQQEPRPDQTSGVPL